MQNERKLLWLEFCLLLANFALVILQAYVAPDARNIYISDSNVVINYGHQEEISQRTVIEPAYEIATQNGENALMRRCAHQECEKVGLLPDRSMIHVLRFVRGESIGGNDIWFQVEHNTGSGFVFSKLVREIDNFA